MFTHFPPKYKFKNYPCISKYSICYVYKSWNKFRNTAGYCNCNIKRILNGDRLHPTCSTKLSDYHCIKMCAVIQFFSSGSARMYVVGTEIIIFHW